MHIVLIVIVSVILGVTPLPTIQQPPNLAVDTNPSSSVIQNSKSEDKETKPAEVKPEEAKPTVEKVQTWQDNPQNCNQEVQYISETAPFNCIDKPQPAPAPVAQAVPADDGSAKSFIYMKESGNNPGAINASSGACGLGQALPCSKMPCSLSDYACQDNFFTGYMQNRYGTWENAKAFWLSHRWW